MRMKSRKGFIMTAMALLLSATVLGCAKPVDAGNGGAKTGVGTPTAAVATPIPDKDKKTPIRAFKEISSDATLRQAASYEDITKVMKAAEQHFAETRHDIGRIAMDFDDAFTWSKSAGADMAMNEGASAPQSGNVETGEYSKTNIQVAGIDEANIIKTDGKFLYIFNSHRNEIYIVSVNGAQMKLMSTIRVYDSIEGNGSAMYLLGDRLVLIASDYEMRAMKDSTVSSTEDKMLRIDMIAPYRSDSAVTRLLTFDISNRENPMLLSTLTQDGCLVSSRCAGGKIYAFTTYGQAFNTIDYDIKAGKVDEDNEKPLNLPCVNGEILPPDDFYIHDEVSSQEFLVLTSMDPWNPSAYIDTKSVLSNADHCYVSENYIYIGGERWASREFPYDRTEVYRFAYADGRITPAGQATVRGQLNDQFSMDEYKGHLRIVTTVTEVRYDYPRLKEEVTDVTGDNIINEYDIDYLIDLYYPVINEKQSNALYIYDENMQLSGQIEDIAKNEHIESARLMGDIGYFVTFRQTDPLFSVDLSDPKNPTILGELKIPGFSEYLHPYGDGLLLGIGFDADENTGARRGLKLSMFDVSDPTDVKEIDKLIVNEYSSTYLSTDHKALLVDVEKNIFGFPAKGYNNGKETSDYLIYSYDRSAGFVKRLSEGYTLDWNTMKGDVYDFRMEFFYSSNRGAFVGNTFYLIQPGYEIRAFDMNSYKMTGQLTIAWPPKVEEEDWVYEPEPVYIDLSSNPSTGYSWIAEVEGESIAWTDVVDILPEDSGMLVGAPITQRFVFDILEPGKTRVTFRYQRAWESEPIHTIVYDIVVGDDYVATIEEVIEN